MKKARILSIAVCLSMLVSGISLTAFATGFDDVENDPTVSWAKQSINKMTDAGYIKGYEDGTFRPFRAITKLECLILMSRMLGLEDEAFAETANAAKEMYGASASKYNATYANELSYLLYCGVLQEKDLVDYASTANANTQLLRYQAAMLMAKLMGADADAKEYSAAKPTYADDASIPANAKSYVEYVTKNGIMNGMDANASGEPQFSPTTSLTRAQVAALLARMMDKLSLTCVSGVVDSVTSKAVTVNQKKYSVVEGTKAYSDGSAIAVKDISKGDFVTGISVCGNALALVTEGSHETTVLYGKIVKKSEGSDGQKITIADYEDESVNESYTLKNGCSIKLNGTKANFGEIAANTFVKIELQNSKVISIATEEKTVNISGVLSDLEYDNEDHIYLRVGDSDGKNVQEYVVSSKGADVTRDNDDAEYRDLASGDGIKLKLTYGKVTSIAATSNSETFSGLMTEIILSSEPAVTITEKGKSNTYKLRSNVKITVAGSSGNIYDLRPNVSVTGILDGNEIKSLTAATVSVNEKGEMNGVVTGKNTSYNVITIKDDNGNTQSVYYNSKTNFLNSNGSAVTVKTIENGSNLSITGVDKNGIFEATIIIVK